MRVSLPLLSRRRLLQGLAGPAALASGLLPGASRAYEEDLRYFRILTGSAGTTAFPVGTAVATAISNPPGSRPCERGGSCGVPGLVAVAISSAGSVANIAAIASDSVESGFALADLVASAHAGEGIYFRRARQPNLRVIANLYPETIHLVVRPGGGIAKVSDLPGKRVGIDRAGSGARFDIEIILAAHGIRLTQVKPAEIDANEAADQLAAGNLDAYFLVAGYPAPTLAQLMINQQAELVPLAEQAAEAALKRHRFFTRDTIPADTYGKHPAIDTLAVGMQWITSQNIDADLIYSICQSLWHPVNRRFLESGPLASRPIRSSAAVEGLGTPLHPGAERYYREAGLLT